MKKYCIIGSGNFAREAYTIISALGWDDRFFAFFQSDASYKPKQIYGIDVLPISKFNTDQHQAVIAIADCKLREKVAGEMPVGTTYYKLIHPSVIISKINIEIGEGAIFCAGTILVCDIKIGKHCILNLGTKVGNDCVIGDYFTATTSVNISGWSTIGNRVYMGTNVSLRGNNKICDDVTIGMGAIVIRNITEPGTYGGNAIIAELLEFQRKQQEMKNA